MTQGLGILGAVASRVVTELVKAGADEQKDATIHNQKSEIKALREEVASLTFKVSVRDITIQHLTLESAEYERLYRDVWDKLLKCQDASMLKDMRAIKAPIDDNPYDVVDTTATITETPDNE